MTEFRNNEKNITGRRFRGARAIGQADQRAWFPQIAVLTFAALVLAVTVAAATIAGAADESVAEPATEAVGYDLYRRGFYEEAMAVWTVAADENGDVGAAFRLGEEHFDAKVVERDVPLAVKYLRMGAEGGDERAQHDLATMYDNGWGVEADVDEAARWYLAAALQGSAVAQYNIGTMYESGESVEQDIEKAYMYFLLAVEGGFPHFSTNALEKISLEMTAQQIKDATVMARQFVPAQDGADDNSDEG
ncbi:MAG: hypothetical protein COA62_02085 [Rhodobiaceae bacterium]|nr:MAG: hypothetical protein COA62_02085 [Rhodobiaceae bacterium]